MTMHAHEMLAIPTRRPLIDTVLPDGLISPSKTSDGGR
jgi:hypothetical protein